MFIRSIRFHGLVIPLAAILSLPACGGGGDETGIRDGTETSDDAGRIDLDRLLAADDDPGSWLTSGRDFRFQHYSPLAQIDTTNVADVGFAWEYRTTPQRGRVLHALED